MLPSTFGNDAFLRVSELFIEVFAAVVLAAGFSLTGFLATTVRNPLFQAENLYLPSVTSSAVGLLTICWGFLISRRYDWNTAAKVSIVVASLSTVIYGILLIWTQRKIRTISKRAGSITQSGLLHRYSSSNLRGESAGDQNYYQNYVQNMFPTSINRSIDQSSLTDEELQRQQMLMLLQPRDQSSTPDASRSTFRIDWQGQDQEDEALQQREFYPPQRNVSETSSASTSNGLANQHLRPWDGVWRGPAPPRSYSASSSGRLAPNG